MTEEPLTARRGSDGDDLDDEPHPPRRARSGDPADGRASTGTAALLVEVERPARAAGADRIRLDTRDDLVEARALYARHGYLEIPAYNDGRYAEHWFEKTLPVGVDDADPARYIKN